MSRRNLSLAQHLATGQLPMFMTGKEIQEHINPWPGDRETRSTNEPDPDEWSGKKQRPETNKELWERKYDESLTNEDSGGAEHDKKYSNLAEDIAHRGFKAPRIPINFDSKEVLGGHHRIAVGAEEHPDYLFPVEHHETIQDARWHLKEHY